jgi:hypothetical protein
MTDFDHLPPSHRALFDTLRMIAASPPADDAPSAAHALHQMADRALGALMRGDAEEAERILERMLRLQRMPAGGRA